MLFAVPQLSAPREVQTDLAPVAYLQQHLGLSRFFSMGPLFPNYGSYFGVAALNSDDFPSAPFARYVRAHLDRYVEPTVFVGTADGGRSAAVPSTEDELLRNLDGYRGRRRRLRPHAPGQAAPDRARGASRSSRDADGVDLPPGRRGAVLLGGAAGLRGAPAGAPAGAGRVPGADPARAAGDAPARAGARAVDGRSVPIQIDQRALPGRRRRAGSARGDVRLRAAHVDGALGLAAGRAWLLGSAVITRRRRGG